MCDWTHSFKCWGALEGIWTLEMSSGYSRRRVTVAVSPILLFIPSEDTMCAIVVSALETPHDGDDIG